MRRTQSPESTAASHGCVIVYIIYIGVPTLGEVRYVDARDAPVPRPGLPAGTHSCVGTPILGISSLGIPVITAAEYHDVAADHLARRAYSRDSLSLASRL